MATYYVDPVSGSDTNTGSLASPWLTLSRAYAIAPSSPIIVNGDSIILRAGTYTLTAATATSVNHNLIAYPFETAIIAGSYQLSNSATGNNFYNRIKMTNTSSIGNTFESVNGNYTFDDCDFVLGTLSLNSQILRSSVSSASNATNILVTNSRFSVSISSGFTSTIAIAIASGIYSIYFRNCVFDNVTSVIYPTSSSRARSLIENCTVKNISQIYNLSSTTSTASGDVKNNTFYNVASLIKWSSTSSFVLDTLKVSNNFLGLTQVINNTSTGTLTLPSILSDSNIALSSTTTTGFTSTNFTTVSTYAAAKFYSLTAGAEDFRIDISSPLANFPQYMGALPPEWDPSIWCSLVPNNKVSSGENYRYLSRTNNQIGSLSGSGETDVNKVLTTSSIVSGTINPNTVMASNANGTLPLNKVAPSKGGTYTGSESNDVITAGELKLSTSKNNLGITVIGTYAGSGGSGSKNFNKELLEKLMGIKI